MQGQFNSDSSVMGTENVAARVEAAAPPACPTVRSPRAIALRTCFW